MPRFAAFLVATLMALIGATLNAPVQAQPAAAEAASIKFTNRTSKPLIVQGVSIVGGMFRKGQMVFVPAGKFAWDNSVPPGQRQYRIFDGTQPSRILNPSARVDVMDTDLHFLIVPTKTGGVDLFPASP